MRRRCSGLLADASEPLAGGAAACAGAGVESAACVTSALDGTAGGSGARLEAVAGAHMRGLRKGLRSRPDGFDSRRRSRCGVLAEGRDDRAAAGRSKGAAGTGLSAGCMRAAAENPSGTDIPPALKNVTCCAGEDGSCWNVAGSDSSEDCRGRGCGCGCGCGSGSCSTAALLCVGLLKSSAARRAATAEMGLMGRPDARANGFVPAGVAVPGCCAAASLAASVAAVAVAACAVTAAAASRVLEVL